MRRAAVAVALVVALVVVAGAAALAVGGYRVQGASMRPALDDGQWVLVDPLARAPERFDVVVFTSSDGRASVKRVVGLPGDGVRVRVDAGEPQVQVQPGGSGPWLTVSGPRQPWTGAEPCCDADGRSSADPVDVRVPPGRYFLLGDNRSASVDSRELGFVAADRLRGRLLLLLPPGTPARDGGWALVGRVSRPGRRRGR